MLLPHTIYQNYFSCNCIISRKE